MTWAVFPCKGVETLLFVLEMTLMNFDPDCLFACLLHGAGQGRKGGEEIWAVTFHLLVGTSNTSREGTMV